MCSTSYRHFRGKFTFTKCMYIEKQTRTPCGLSAKTFPRASTFITSTTKCHYTPRKPLKTTDGLTASLTGSIVATMESSDIPKLQHAVFRHVFCSIPLKTAAKRGAHLTADVVLQALKKRAARRRRGTREMTDDELEQKALQREYRLDSASDHRQLASLTPIRRSQEECLAQSRGERRLRTRLRFEKGAAPQ